MDETKSPHYALIIDKKRNDILAFLYSAATKTEGGRIVFDLLLKQSGIPLEEVRDFIKEWSTKEHDLGWCESPTCAFNKEQV